MTRLEQIQDAVDERARKIVAVEEHWPCRKGCDECCRRLAAVPWITREEWLRLAAALNALPAETAELARQRIRASVNARRPVICPLLDTAAGACLTYAARPVACREYGFYAERESVLGCQRIAARGEAAPTIVWGNHLALEEELCHLGPRASLAAWLAAEA